MRPGQRFGLSAIEKRDVWNRWKAGQSLHEIGRAFDKPHSCIRSVLLPRGGIPPPPVVARACPRQEDRVLSHPANRARCSCSIAMNFTPIPCLGLLRWTAARARTSPVGASISN